MVKKYRCIAMTGASGGIGDPLLGLLKDRGESFVLIGSSRQRLEQSLRRHNLNMANVTIIQADLTLPEGIESAAEQLQGKAVDLLINVAGVQYYGALQNITPKHTYAMYAINEIAPTRLIQAVLPGMLERHEGHVVNVGSTFGSICFPYFSVYSASKAGLRGLTEALCREVEDEGVKVTYVSPRGVNTSMNSEKMKPALGCLDEPYHVAKTIVQAIDSGKKEFYIGYPEKIFVKINYLCRFLVDKGVKKQKHMMKGILK